MYQNPYMRIPALTKDPVDSKAASLPINQHVVLISIATNFGSVKGKANLWEEQRDWTYAFSLIHGHVDQV